MIGQLSCGKKGKYNGIEVTIGNSYILERGVMAGGP
jgi:hypothetical protein